MHNIRIRPVLLLVPVLLLALVTTASAIAVFPPAYAVEFVGSGWPTAINEAGQIAGWRSNADIKEAWVYTPGTGQQVLPVPAGMPHASANDINDSGVVVGSVSDSFYGYGEAAKWEPDGGGYTVTLLGKISEHAQSSATAINNVGDIVGFSVSGTIAGSPAVLFTAPGGIQNLGALGFSATPEDINDQRQLVGGQYRLDLDTGIVENLGLPAGFIIVYARAINESGQVAATGVLATSTYDNQAVVRYTDGSGWQKLSGHGRYNTATDINDSGDVFMTVVSYCLNGGASDFGPSIYLQGHGAYCVVDLLPEEERDWYFSNTAGAFGGLTNAGHLSTMAGNNVTGQGGAVSLTLIGQLPPPLAAGNLTAEPHLPTWQQPWNAITLTWTDNSRINYAQRIERRVSGASEWVEVDIVNGTAPSFWDMSVDLGITYDYRIVALGLGGAADPSNVATATSPATPVDREPPVLTFVAPIDGAQVDGNVQIVIEATDNVGLNHMDVSFSPNMGDSEICRTSPGGATAHTLSCTWNTRGLAPGIYSLSAYASDTIGNYSTQSISVQVGSTANPTLRSSAIDLAAKKRRGTLTVTGKVSVVDQDGAAVKSAMVTATWTQPDGSMITRTSYSNRKGVAEFAAYGNDGVYVLTVINIVKSGYAFDATGSVLSASIDTGGNVRGAAVDDGHDTQIFMPVVVQ